MDNNKSTKIKIDKEIVESIAADAINMYVREVLIPNNFLTDAYFDFPDDEFRKLRGKILQILSKNYENIEVFR
jgi:hypothetical protein